VGKLYARVVLTAETKSATLQDFNAHPCTDKVYEKIQHEFNFPSCVQGKWDLARD